MQLDSKKVKLCYSSNKLNIKISLRNKTSNGKMVIKALGKQFRQFKNNTFFLYLCLNGILLNERGFVGWDHYGGVLHEILNDWSLGEQWEPRETLRFEGNKMNCFPRDQSLSDLFYSWKFIKPRSINGGRRSAGCTVTFWRHRFCNVARSEILAGNSFIFWCHVTSK